MLPKEAGPIAGPGAHSLCLALLCYSHPQTVVVRLEAIQARSVGLVDAGHRSGGLGVLLLLVLGEV